MKDWNVSHASSSPSANSNPWEATLQNLPTESHWQKFAESRWARVECEFQYVLCHLTADLLAPFAEITYLLEELLFIETDRMAVPAAVKQVIPSLGMERDGDYEGLGGHIRVIVNKLLEKLRLSTKSTGC